MDVTCSMPPEVTVVCVTYNHAKYIMQAMESFLSQETNFPFQVFVADDCSTDGTREIVSRCEREHPDVVRAFLPETRRGAECNLIEMCSKAGTEFIAICDGDDYWTDSRKLQKQRDYMRAHSAMRACFHDTEIKVEGDPWFLAKDYANTPDGKLLWCAGHKRFRKQEGYSIADYVPCGFVHSSSMFIRWDYDLEIPDWFYSHILGDYTLWCLQVGLGEFGYIDEVMSVYRRHTNANYYFRSREEFWGATKPDWICIDGDLRLYFEELGASQELLAVFDERLKDDLGKLLKYAYRSGDPALRDEILARYSKTIERCTGLSCYGVDDGISPSRVKEIGLFFQCERPSFIRRKTRRLIQIIGGKHS